jgi:ABC-type glycerol-3-phosphate transport system substrate-binding protein
MTIGILLLLIGSAVLAAGCGSDGSPSAGQSSSQSTNVTTISTTTTDTPTIVGRWKRVNECTQLVKALDEAGLGAIAPSVVGDYFPG